MTIGTEPLTAQVTWREVDNLVNFLAALGIDQVAITYGWGCHAADIEQPVRVPLPEVVGFLQKSIAQAIYHLGENNLYIDVGNPALKITLCHDADIHFEADDKGIETRLRDEWQRRGLRVWPVQK